MTAMNQVSKKKNPNAVPDPFAGMGVKIKLSNREDFLKVKETLTRMGSLLPPNTLYQTCFILHKKGSYAIMHHLEMKKLDGDIVSMTDEDRAHLHAVASLLDQWGLVEVIGHDEDLANESVTIIPFKQKSSYKLVPLYAIGKPR